MSFQSKFVSSSNKAALLYLVTAKAEGKPAWYYLQVDEPKHKAFKKQMETGSLDLAAYGKILYSGWGETPPENVAELVRQAFTSES